MNVLLHISPSNSPDYLLNRTRFISTKLIGKKVIAIYKDGIGISKITTTTTGLPIFEIPAPKEAIHNRTYGTITIQQVLETGEDLRILYENL